MFLLPQILTVDCRESLEISEKILTDLNCSQKLEISIIGEICMESRSTLITHSED